MQCVRSILPTRPRSRPLRRGRRQGSQPSPCMSPACHVVGGYCTHTSTADPCAMRNWSALGLGLGLGLAQVLGLRTGLWIAEAQELPWSWKWDGNSRGFSP